jgi:SagB-type dehydrogenase family enzyme
MQTTRLRRARTLFAHWEDGRLTVTNWRTRSSATVGSAVVGLLDFFDRWRHPQEAVDRLGAFPAAAARAGVRKLLAADLLVREHTAEAERDAATSRAWARWHPAGPFHYATRDVPFVPEEQMAAVLRRFLAVSKQPPQFKRHPGAPRVRLPAAAAPDAPFPSVLMARRTHRHFAPVPVPLGALSTLLYYTFGVTGSVRSPALGPLIHKTSPSGGSRHPVEAYVAALRVDGLSAGLYHYASGRHELAQLRAGNLQRRVAGWCADQAFVANAAAVVFLTAVLPRVSWKYRFGRAYRIVLLDAGHVGQTFCLAATWLGLAPFCTAALRDTIVEQVLGVDGVTEVALYVLGVGVPATRSRRK